MMERVRLELGSGDQPDPRREVAYGVLIGVAAFFVSLAIGPGGYLELFAVALGIAVSYVAFVLAIGILTRGRPVRS